MKESLSFAQLDWMLLRTVHPSWLLPTDDQRPAEIARQQMVDY